MEDTRSIHPSRMKVKQPDEQEDYKMNKGEIERLAKIEQKLENVVSGQQRLENVLEKYCNKQDLYNKQVITNTEQLRKLGVNHDKLQQEKTEEQNREKNWSVQKIIAIWSIMTTVISTAVSLLVSHLNSR